MYKVNMLYKPKSKLGLLATEHTNECDKPVLKLQLSHSVGPFSKLLKALLVPGYFVHKNYYLF